MEDDVEKEAVMHVSVGHVIGIDHAGQLFAGQRLRRAGAHDQSMHVSGGVGGHVPQGGDVGGRGDRSGMNLKKHDTFCAMSRATTSSAEPIGAA